MRRSPPIWIFAIGGFFALILVVAMRLGHAVSKALPVPPSNAHATTLEPATVDAAWPTFPIVAQVDDSKVVYLRGGLGADGTAVRAPLGNFFLSWKLDACDWGGSACSQSTSTQRDLVIGADAALSDVIARSGTFCTTVLPQDRDGATNNDGCSASAFTLRRAPSDGEFVVSYGVEGDEKALLAFRRVR